MSRAYRGELAYTYLFDLGGEARLTDVARLVEGTMDVERVEPNKSAPPYVQLVRPAAFQAPARVVETEEGPKEFRVRVDVYAIGAIGVTLRLPFAVDTLADVHRLSNMRPKDSGGMEAIARGYAEDFAAKVRPALVETYPAQVDPEAYLVVVLTETDRPALDLLQDERQLLAGIVTGERKPERLSAEEVSDNLRTWFRYYQDDLVVVDWDRALVIEPSGKYDDVLTVMSLANLELLELRAYDRYLDSVLERAYGDLTRFYGRGGLFRSARDVQADLSNARIDLVRVTDSINNIGKIFGDYYLAKLHVGLAERFHLREWETIVREKMSTLNELYVLASHEVEHRRGILLEAMIVLLFVVDLILIFLVSGK